MATLIGVFEADVLCRCGPAHDVELPIARKRASCAVAWLIRLSELGNIAAAATPRKVRATINIVEPVLGTQALLGARECEIARAFSNHFEHARNLSR